jgi:beta-1,4-mannosyltransferase
LIMNKFGVLAWPAYSTKSNNPYNFLIYSEIEKMGHQVYEFDFNLKSIIEFSFSRKYMIFHIHWPSNILTWSTALQARRRLGMFYIFLKIIKISGKKVVWTVHNLQSHESEHPQLQQRLYKMLYRHVDGFISLNKNGLEYIKESSPDKKRQKFCYIPHPHYKGYYQNDLTRAEARSKLGITEEKKVFLFLGQIRRYKNVTGLITAFKALNLPDKLLLIAGKVHDEMQEEMARENKNNGNIIIHDIFIDDAELQIYFNSADLVVNPYTNIFNSGSVFLNMSFNKPTLAPAIGAFPEIQREIGDKYIKLYQDEMISSSALYKSMQEALEEKETLSDTDLSVFSSDQIAAETLKFYHQLL